MFIFQGFGFLLLFCFLILVNVQNFENFSLLLLFKSTVMHILCIVLLMIDALSLIGFSTKYPNLCHGT